jgi:hypothetical protein
MNGNGRPKAALPRLARQRAQGQSYSPSATVGDLDRRRARHEAQEAIELLRAMLEGYDSGVIPLDELAFELGFIGAYCGSRACRGLLAAS